MAKWKKVAKKESKKAEPMEFYIDPVSGLKIQVCKPMPDPKKVTARC